MEVKVDKTFQKDTKKIQDKVLPGKVANSIINVQQAENSKFITRFACQSVQPSCTGRHMQQTLAKIRT